MRSSFRIICSSLITGLVLSAGIVSAQAQPIRHFNLPEQTLGASLRDIGAQGNLNVLFDAPSVEDIQVPAIETTGTADEVLTRLLKGSGYQHRYLNETTVVLAELRKSNANANDQARLASHSSAGETASEGSSNTAVSRVHAVESTTMEDGTSARTNDDQMTRSSEDKSERVAEVVVTGTHIRGAAMLPVPSLTFSASDLRQAGFTTTQEFLRRLPQNFAGVSSDGGLATGGSVLARSNSIGAAAFDLRGLGPGSTLVLLNGQRIAGALGGRLVDVSMIPVSAIEHIDVVTGGRSADSISSI